MYIFRRTSIFLIVSLRLYWLELFSVEQGEGTEILGHCPSGRGSKRKQSEVDAVVPSFTKKAQSEDLFGYDLN